MKILRKALKLMGSWSDMTGHKIVKYYPLFERFRWGFSFYNFEFFISFLLWWVWEDKFLSNIILEKSESWRIRKKSLISFVFKAIKLFVFFVNPQWKSFNKQLSTDSTREVMRGHYESPNSQSETRICQLALNFSSDNKMAALQQAISVTPRAYFAYFWRVLP